MHLPSDHSFVSRRHLQVELDGWDVVAARPRQPRRHDDRARPDATPQRMRPGDAYVLEPGTVLDLAARLRDRFEHEEHRMPVSAPVIPGYTFVQHLGSGGFADVFLYEQQWPRQRVAVKVVRPTCR